MFFGRNLNKFFMGSKFGRTRLRKFLKNFLKKGFSAPPNILISGGGAIVILCQVLVALMKQGGVFADVYKFPVVRLSY